jgi:hypothetical protein
MNVFSQPTLLATEGAESAVLKHFKLISQQCKKLLSQTYNFILISRNKFWVFIYVALNVCGLLPQTYCFTIHSDKVTHIHIHTK